MSKILELRIYMRSGTKEFVLFDLDQFIEEVSKLKDESNPPRCVNYYLENALISSLVQSDQRQYQIPSFFNLPIYTGRPPLPSEEEWDEELQTLLDDDDVSFNQPEPTDEEQSPEEKEKANSFRRKLVNEFCNYDVEPKDLG